MSESKYREQVELIYIGESKTVYGIVISNGARGSLPKVVWEENKEHYELLGWRLKDETSRI